jgi:hypothetical protein
MFRLAGQDTLEDSPSCSGRSSVTIGQSDSSPPNQNGIDRVYLLSTSKKVRLRKQINSQTNTPNLSNSTSASLTNPKSQIITQNNTFATTDFSFSVSHERLLKLITDVEPFEPNWEGIKSITFTGKRLESTVKLKHWLPYLDEIDL